MNKDCGKCHGKGGKERRKPKGTYIGFFGSSTEWIRCDACKGTGVNPDYRSKQCPGCWFRTIEYSAKTPSEKVPSYCPTCRDNKRAEKERERQNRQSQPRHEERPRYEQRPRQDDKWQQKSCPGLKGEGGCSSRNTIRYRTDWNRIPDLCPDCIAKIKAIKVELAANTLTGKCEKCSGETRYNKAYKPPRFCKKCKEEREASKRTKACPYCEKEVVWYAGDREYECCYDCAGKKNRNRVDQRLGEYDVLPASGRTPHDMGCTDAHIKGPSKEYGGIHVSVFSRNLDYHEHVSWDTDIDGNYKQGTTHVTDAMSKVLSQHGWDRW